MRDSCNLAWAVLAIWLNSYLNHQSEPTWTNVLTVLFVWFVFDVVGVVWRFFRA
jgi:hypothetical protein